VKATVVGYCTAVADADGAGRASWSSLWPSAIRRELQ